MEYYGNNDWRDYQSLKHWKYIKREKVNGKWRYYYEDSKDKLSISKVDKGYVESSGNRSYFVKSEKYKTANNMGGYKDVDKETWDKTETGTHLLIGDKKASEVIKEQVKTTANAVKDKVKDKLGYDERDAVNKALDDRRVAAAREWATGYNFEQSAHNKDLSKKANREQYEKDRKAYMEATETYRKAGEEYEKAMSDYLKTPIGKIENAKNQAAMKIEKASSWLKKKFKIK